MLQFAPFFFSPRRSCSTRTVKTRYAEPFVLIKTERLHVTFSPSAKIWARKSFFFEALPHPDTLSAVHRDVQTSALAAVAQREKAEILSTSDKKRCILCTSGACDYFYVFFFF